MSKDRAAPFSRKHRRYWIPVTGGMIVIGGINIALGLSSYKAPEEPMRIELYAPRDAGNTLGASALPPEVMRAFAVKYPHTLPAAVERTGSGYVIAFPPNGEHHHATFAINGAFVGED